MTVIQSADSLNEPGSITLDIMVFAGPYRGGRFCFCFHIPANYPFRQIEVWATQPIWHPNVDLRTGKVAIPLDWSPVLTLTSFAMAVQVSFVFS
jgi:ubiquitin-protein ligase